MDKYYPEGDEISGYTVYGYLVAQTLVVVLTQSGDNLTTREHHQAGSKSQEFRARHASPAHQGQHTGPNDFAPIKQMQMEVSTAKAGSGFGR